MAQMGDVDVQPNVKRRKITSVDSQSSLIDTTQLISTLGLDTSSRMSMRLGLSLVNPFFLT